MLPGLPRLPLALPTHRCLGSFLRRCQGILQWSEAPHPHLCPGTKLGWSLGSEINQILERPGSSGRLLTRTTLNCLVQSSAQTWGGAVSPAHLISRDTDVLKPEQIRLIQVTATLTTQPEAWEPHLQGAFCPIECQWGWPADYRGGNWGLPGVPEGPQEGLDALGAEPAAYLHALAHGGRLAFASQEEFQLLLQGLPLLLEGHNLLIFPLNLFLQLGEALDFLSQHRQAVILDRDGRSWVPCGHRLVPTPPTTHRQQLQAQDEQNCCPGTPEPQAQDTCFFTLTSLGGPEAPSAWLWAIPQLWLRTPALCEAPHLPSNSL